jgi:hypothetical protein
MLLLLLWLHGCIVFQPDLLVASCVQTRALLISSKRSGAVVRANIYKNAVC